MSVLYLKYGKIDMQTKNCKACGKSFNRNPKYSSAQWARAQYCSRECLNLDAKDDPREKLLERREISKTGCWLWTGPKDGPDGYGLYGGGGLGTSRVHRLSYMLFVGPIPDGMLVCHKCDVRMCFNPDHLFLGTYYDNVHDMISKGRAKHPLGKNVPNAILNADSVVAIREDTRLQRVIAAEYKIAQTTVSAIKTGRNWSHIKNKA